MEQQVRCKKCGRVLKSAQSMALGIGSTCAGQMSNAKKTLRAQLRQNYRRSYQDPSNNNRNTIISGDLSSKPLGKRESIRRIREERRRLFEERKPFQCGVLSKAHTPLIYVPSEDGKWKENLSGRVISHERLQEYLKRYNFI